ncbi:uncharacterized protein LOC120335541 [Styela clava]
MMATCGIPIGSALDTIGKVAIFTSQWSTIQAFIQATMWHNTEPKTLGVSYWATALLLISLCVPGLIYFLFSLIFSTSKILSQRNGLLKKLICCLVRVSPATMLTISSSPCLDEYADIRTCVLSCGVISMSVYVIIIAWKQQENFVTEDILIPNSNYSPVEKEMGCMIICKRTRGLLKNLLTTSNIGNSVIIAVFLSMSVRWCYGSINIFYEDWKASSVMLICVILYSISVFVLEVTGGMEKLISFKTIDNSSKECNGNHDNYLKAQVQLYKANANGSDQLDKFSISTKLQYDEKYPEAHDDLLKDTTLCQNPNDHQIPSPIKDNAIVASVPDHNVHNANISVAAQQCYAFFYAIILATAIGSLSSLSLWILSSPDVLCLWGEIPTYLSGNLILASFAVGCLAAILVDVEALSKFRDKESDENSTSKFQATRHRIFQIGFHGFIIILLIGGTSLILYTKNSSFLFGSCLLCLSFPLLFRIVLFSSSNLTSTCKTFQTNGKRKTTSALPGVLVGMSGFVFFILHVLKIMFINPQLSSIVHGKIGLITWIEVILGVLPLIICPIVKGKINVVDRLRSSSTGPLLSPDSKRKPTNNFSDQSRKEFWEIRKYKKASQALFIFIILISAGISKYQSTQYKISCDASAPAPVCEANNKNNFDLRVMTWNILLGNKMNGRNNLDSITTIMDEYNPNILALQEANTLPAYWGGKDTFGYLQQNSKSCRRAGKIVNPMQGAFEVGMLSTLEIIDKSASVLPNGDERKLPSYTMAKMACNAQSLCQESNDIELGSGLVTRRHNKTIHFYTLHAVYKNWTCERSSDLSRQQMSFLHDDIRKLPREDPVIVMGDFNINPSEPELDMWFDSDLEFKSVLWPSRTTLNDTSNTICKDNCPSNDSKCVCKCLDNSSDPPNSTLLNRRAAVDHIFYRGLRLVEGQILTDIYKIHGNVSDHYPILADFAFIE